MAPLSTKNSSRVEFSVSTGLEVIDNAQIHYRKEATTKFGKRKSALMSTRTKDDLKEHNEAKNRMGSVRVRKILKTEYFSINFKTWEWLKKAMERGEPISDKHIKEKALSFAHDESVLNFSASNGWLDSFKKRHGVRMTRTSSSSSHAHANTNVGLPISAKKKALVANEPSLEESPEAKLDYSLPKPGWIRLYPEEFPEVCSTKPVNEKLKCITSHDLSYLMDPLCDSYISNNI